MTKRLWWMLTATVLAVTLTGCPSLFGTEDDGTEDSPEDEQTVEAGTLEGIARFANTGDHEGIIVSLEAVDAGQSATVSGSVAAQSITAHALVDQTTTDAEGTYSFSDLEPGTYTVYASSNDSSERAVRTNVSVVEASTVTVEELLLTATGSISGTVVNSDSGTGEAGWLVAVGATSFMAMTGSEGSFEISDIPVGTDYPIMVMKGHKQFAGFYADVSAGETTDTGSYNVTLSGDWTWHAANGAPAASQGAVGDFYLDLDTGDMYQKGSDGWSVSVNLIGPAGADGEDGAEGPEGPAGADGADGADGTSLVWKGTSGTHLSEPETNWAYYNSDEGKSYVYDGADWQVLAQDGEPGTPIRWQGPATSHPGSPQLNWAYYNESDGVSYIYDGSAWQVLARDGAAGADGAQGPQGPAGADGSDGAQGPAGSDGIDGVDGISISWKGTDTSHPTDPTLNWAYYNSDDGKSYVYNGSSWQVLAQDGQPGTPIRWQGSNDVAPDSPQLNWAYYNSTDGKSYVYDGSSWQVLAHDGAAGTDGADGSDGAQGPEGPEGPQGPAGVDGISISWKGTATSHPTGPTLNWAYYNETDGVSYIYDGTGWVTLAQDGTDLVSEAPGEVTNLSAVGTGGGVTLTWDNPSDSDLSRCEILYGEGTADSWWGIELDGAGTEISGLTNGIEYTFVVRTVDTEGNQSAGVSVISTPDEPSILDSDTNWSFQTVMASSDTATFDMGSADGESDESPVHTVTLTRPYAINTYEITNDQFAAVMNEALDNGWVTASTSTVQNVDGNQQELLDVDSSDSRIGYNGSQLTVDSGYGDHPVTEVSWYGAVAFAYYLSELDGKQQTYDLSDWSMDADAAGYRLPTEAEWEYAARGGADSNGYTYAGSDDEDTVAWNYSNSGLTTHTVGTKAENEIGTYDMSGNAREWVNDWYDNSYYSSSPESDPEGPASGSFRVTRGGSWGSSASYVRTAYRDCVNPGGGYGILGFRLVVPSSE